MRVLKNILITLGLLIAVIVAATVIAMTFHAGAPGAASKAGHDLLWTLIVGTAIWAAISSYRLEFRKYKTGMSYHPMTVFFVHLLLWVVVFPWFLTVRDNIKDGRAELRDEFKDIASNTIYSQVSAPQSAEPPLVRGGFEAPQQLPPQPTRSSMPPPLPPPTPKESSPVPPPLPSSIPAPPPLRPAAPVPPPLPSAATIPPPLPGPPPLPKSQPQPTSINDRFEQLQKLAQLREQGILTEAEFQGEKQKILGQA